MLAFFCTVSDEKSNVIVYVYVNIETARTKYCDIKGRCGTNLFCMCEHVCEVPPCICARHTISFIPRAIVAARADLAGVGQQYNGYPARSNANLLLLFFSAVSYDVIAIVSSRVVARVADRETNSFKSNIIYQRSTAVSDP